MNEDDDAVSFIDTVHDVEIKRLAGFFTPHFMRFSPDGKYGYVANIGAHHMTRVDLATLEIDEPHPARRLRGPPNETLAPDEGGFADAQIDSTACSTPRTTRPAACSSTTPSRAASCRADGRREARGSRSPSTRSPTLPRRHVVPNFGDRTVSLHRRQRLDGRRRTLPGDDEAYGVNYSPLTPDKAFVMNRVRQDIAVVDTATAQITSRIPVGGNTETASTTADGK